MAHILVQEWCAIIRNEFNWYPKMTYYIFLKRLATELLIAFFMATASSYLVNSSMATKIQMHSLEGGFMGPMKSSSQLWKRHGAIVR